MRPSLRNLYTVDRQLEFRFDEDHVLNALDTVLGKRFQLQ